MCLSAGKGAGKLLESIFSGTKSSVVKQPQNWIQSPSTILRIPWGFRQLQIQTKSTRKLNLGVRSHNHEHKVSESTFRRTFFFIQLEGSLAGQKKIKFFALVVQEQFPLTKLIQQQLQSTKQTSISNLIPSFTRESLATIDRRIGSVYERLKQRYSRRK